MKVKEVLMLAAENLGRQDLSDALAREGEEEGEEQTEEQLDGYPDEIKSLVRCFNLVESEVALDYFPLKKEETFVPMGRIVPYTQFSSSPVDVLKVTDERGGGVEFEVRTAHLYLPEARGKVNITYSYAPAPKTLLDDSEFSGKVSPRLMSFGVAAEFCLSASRFSEAAVWERRFLDALKAAKLIRRKLSMRARRWV
ncbi:MAG: hypothetical protein K2G44_06020 [Clostridia bacterium]|nr:hypothetical protein [Clostridia bacterium]